MRTLVYYLVNWIAGIHDKILSINDSRSFFLTDKQLHFLVIGLLGLAMIFIIYPIFKSLAENGHTMVVAWIYVFTVILVITFAIEIGQWYSGTGTMELADVAYGVAGFIVIFAVFAIIRGIYHAILRLVKKDRN
ncbi:MAG: hypothetical protein K5653_05545 [Clostridiales bacterium]|nr:hypothetical protein [Clostridiales bacterium]